MQVDGGGDGWIGEVGGEVEVVGGGGEGGGIVVVIDDDV